MHDQNVDAVVGHFVTPGGGSREIVMSVALHTAGSSRLEVLARLQGATGFNPETLDLQSNPRLHACQDASHLTHLHSCWSVCVSSSQHVITLFQRWSRGSCWGCRRPPLVSAFENQDAGGHLGEAFFLRNHLKHVSEPGSCKCQLRILRAFLGRCKSSRVFLPAAAGFQASASTSQGSLEWFPSVCASESVFIHSVSFVWTFSSHVQRLGSLLAPPVGY